jgi:hypothetical protein
MNPGVSDSPALIIQKTIKNLVGVIKLDVTGTLMAYNQPVEILIIMNLEENLVVNLVMNLVVIELLLIMKHQPLNN